MQKLNETQTARLAASLREWSSRSGLTQKEIEALTGIDQTQISRIMAGRFKRIHGNVDKLCKYANIDPETVIARHELPDGRDPLSTAKMVARYVGVPEERAGAVRELLDRIAVLLHGHDSQH